MLKNKDKRNPFSVPENYFQNFNADIMNKLPEVNIKEQTKIVPLWKSLKTWVAAAAVFVGVGFFGLQYMNTDNPTIDVSTTPTPSLAYHNSNEFENDYYDFLQDEATRLAYEDALSSTK